MTKIAILASGSGSNAEAIIKSLDLSKDLCVELIISNNADAGVLKRAEKYHVQNIVVNSGQASGGLLLKALRANNIDFVVLAGYMKLIPSNVIEAFPNKIVNIHPALLPKYGGKGMYGENVHKAVAEAKETESGITIHFVNQKYDEGAIIFQKSVALTSSDDYKEIGSKVLKLEHKYYSQIIKKMIIDAAS